MKWPRMKLFRVTLELKPFSWRVLSSVLANVHLCSIKSSQAETTRVCLEYDYSSCFERRWGASAVLKLSRVFLVWLGLFRFPFQPLSPLEIFSFLASVALHTYCNFKISPLWHCSFLLQSDWMPNARCVIAWWLMQPRTNPSEYIYRPGPGGPQHAVAGWSFFWYT